MTRTIDVEQLYTAARQLTTDLLPRLAAEIPEQPTTLESSIGSHRKHVAAPIPWNQPAALLFLEIHGDARRYENLLTLRLFGHAKYRGGTDTQTADCINRLPVLIAHGIDKQLDALDLADPARDLHAWPRRVRAILDELGDDEQPWTRAPGDLRCPYCDRALELAPGWTHRADSADLVCRRCKTADAGPVRWAPSQWLGLLQDNPDELTAVDVTNQYGMPGSTLRSWVHRGRLQHVGKRAGHRVFARADVEALLERTQHVGVAS